jgi:hypothetical protein
MMPNGPLSHLTAQGYLLLERTGTGSLSRGRHRLREGGEVNLGYWVWPLPPHLASLDLYTRFNKYETGNTNSQVSSYLLLWLLLRVRVSLTLSPRWCEVFHFVSDGGWRDN